MLRADRTPTALLDVKQRQRPAKRYAPSNKDPRSHNSSVVVASCDLRILMDQPTESISSDDGPSRQDDSGFARPEWWHLSQGTMRTVNVVVIGVLSQHRLQLSASEDEHPVQHLPPNGPDPSLRVGIRPWRPHRRAQHLDPFSGKHCIEPRGELRIPIADQEPEAADTIVKGHEQIPGLLGYPHPRRLRGHTNHVDPPGRDL